MDNYQQVVALWQSYKITKPADLDKYLDSFRVLFAYNFGKIENDEITYHDTREIFENGKVSGFSGNPRVLMINGHPPLIIYDEDKRDYYAALQSYDEPEEIGPIVNFLHGQGEKTWGRALGRWVNGGSAHL